VFRIVLAGPSLAVFADGVARKVAALRKTVGVDKGFLE